MLSVDHKAYMRKIGAKGGKAGRGKAKARTSAQARAAVLVRWRKPAGNAHQRRKARRKAGR